jgi:DNA-binding transcriptional LysR family regulator
VFDGLDPTNLIALHVLLEERHVTRAARRLGLGQSSMSHRLRRLREALGDPLFVRARGTLVPTPRAEALAGPLAAALRALRAAVAAPAPFDPATDAYTLSLALPDLLIPLVPGLLAELAVEAPRVDLRISGITATLADSLAAGDPALALAPVGFVGDTTIARPLGELRFGVVARRGHPILARPLTLARWLAHPHAVVRLGNERANPVGEELARRGLVRRIGVEVPSFLAGLLLVARSDLLMNAPIPLVHEVADTLGIVVRDAPIPLPRVPFALLWHEKFQSDPPHRWARERVFAAVQRRIGGRAR